jgi:methionyl-tRNA formyltransferase
MARVHLLGKGSLAIRIGEWFLRDPCFELNAVVPVIPEPRWTGSLLDWADENGVTVVGSGDYRDLPGDGESNGVDVVLSVFYDKIIDVEVIAGCRRILNLHNSPLPRYRGMASVNWALRNEEAEHGVTLHEIVPEVDAGPIVGQMRLSIYPEIEEVEDAYSRALAYGYELVVQTLPNIDRITPRPQDESQASYYSAAAGERLGDRRGFRRAGAGEPLLG